MPPLHTESRPVERKRIPVTSPKKPRLTRSSSGSLMNAGLLDMFDSIEKTHWWWEGRRELLKELLQGKKPVRILDVGCGTGETLFFMHKCFPGSRLYGVDYLPSAVRFSKQRGLKDVLVADALKLPFEANRFDIVLFLDVLEHIQDHRKALEEAKRVLKPGGSIVVTAPALQFMWSRHDRDQGHQRRYTRTAFRQLAEQCGMKPAFIKYFNVFFSLPIITIRLLSNVPFLSWLANYDNGFNYDIAHKQRINSFLKKCVCCRNPLFALVEPSLGNFRRSSFGKTPVIDCI